MAAKVNAAGGELVTDTTPEVGGTRLSHATGGEIVAVHVIGSVLSVLI